MYVHCQTTRLHETQNAPAAFAAGACVCFDKSRKSFLLDARMTKIEEHDSLASGNITEKGADIPTGIEGVHENKRPTGSILDLVHDRDEIGLRCQQIHPIRLHSPRDTVVIEIEHFHTIRFARWRRYRARPADIAVIFDRHPTLRRTGRKILRNIPQKFAKDVRIIEQVARRPPMSKVPRLP